MKRKTAVVSFLCVCILLAVLLLFKVINPVTGGVIFAIALVVFGGLSKGFKAKNQ